ncbi:MAG: hypothetical protein KBS77_03520 [Bacteroidales bacterium]|nr:hypothetical protein [Candidatus Colicola faecequi]
MSLAGQWSAASTSNLAELERSLTSFDVFRFAIAECHSCLQREALCFTFFIRKGVYANLDDEADMEKAFLKRMVRYQETEISARQMMVDTNEYLLDQLKHRVAELESRLRYIQNHPEAISELEPLPEFKLIVPYIKGTDAPKVYTNPTPEEKRQARVHKKYAKIKEDEIREETLYDTPKKEE